MKVNGIAWRKVNSPVLRMLSTNLGMMVLLCYYTCNSGQTQCESVFWACSYYKIYIIISTYIIANSWQKNCGKNEHLTINITSYLAHNFHIYNMHAGDWDSFDQQIILPHNFGETELHCFCVAIIQLLL